MHVREKHGIVGVVQYQTETAFRREIAELLVKHGLWERVFELIEIDLGVTTLPCIENLHIRPIVLGQHASVFRLQRTQFVGAFGVRLQVRLDGSTNLRTDVQIGFECAMLYVVAITVKILIYIVLVVLVSAVLSNKMAGPIYRFEQTCKAVAKGDFSQRVHLRQGDQLTELQDEFNKMMDRVETEINSKK